MMNARIKVATLSSCIPLFSVSVMPGKVITASQVSVYYVSYLRTTLPDTVSDGLHWHPNRTRICSSDFF
jgi:hypothetical protein